jgi:hypothetical protein
MHPAAAQDVDVVGTLVMLGVIASLMGFALVSHDVVAARGGPGKAIQGTEAQPHTASSSNHPIEARLYLVWIWGLGPQLLAS